MKKGSYHYFVEGEDDAKVINILKTDLRLIIPGKVQIFNVMQEKITNPRLMSLKADTIVILVFDTDVGETTTLLDNIKILKKAPNVKDVYCITQVKKLEDELIRSCDIKQIKDLTGSRSNGDFKRDMLKDNAFAQKLKKHHFDFNIFWNSIDKNFCNVDNDAAKVKIK